ncbi:hypothetical protein OC842_007284 [Tilletia horrida]|uniref:NADAR domain-containing protein n=1 Tax=Tilletia horrida TaxID=155126 RepID=A0AAN6G8N9_9BASI|nr:hypothetical protein OC842_007284 [Tilletia horrida]
MAAPQLASNGADDGTGSGFWLKNPFAKMRAPRRASAPLVDNDPAGLHAEEHVDDDAGAAPPRTLKLNGPSRSGRETPLSASVQASPLLQPQDQPLGASQLEEEIEELQDEVPSKIEFFAPSQPYYWLSNAAAYEVVLDGIKYPTAEHCFQSLKFLPHRPEVARKVRKASTPSEAVRTARKHTADVQRGWRRDGLNLVAMRRVMLLKFSQHSDLRKALLSTGEAQLVNAAPTDVFWGNGGGRGRNEFGKALVGVREALRSIDRLGAGSGAITV